MTAEITVDRHENLDGFSTLKHLLETPNTWEQYITLHTFPLPGDWELSVNHYYIMKNIKDFERDSFFACIYKLNKASKSMYIHDNGRVYSACSTWYHADGTTSNGWHTNLSDLRVSITKFTDRLYEFLPSRVLSFPYAEPDTSDYNIADSAFRLTVQQDKLWSEGKLDAQS